MFNIMTRKYNNNFSTATRIFVPGIKVPMFLQNGRVVNNGTTIGHAMLVKSTNPEFRKTAGSDFVALVGHDFFGFSHKRQIAEMAFCALIDDRIEDVNDVIDASRLSWEPADILDGYLSREVVTTTDDALECGNVPNIASGVVISLAKLVGWKTAKKVINSFYHKNMKAASRAVKVIVKCDKAAGDPATLYAKKGFKAELKDDKKINKLSIKNAKPTVKAETKSSDDAIKEAKAAVKKYHKEQKAAAKAASKAADDIAAAAESIVSDGPETAANPA